MPEPLLTIFNKHAPECGTPPALANEAGNLYVGYFENRFGEQWVFAFDRTAREARLWGGDVGWEEPLTVRDGNVDDLVLSDEESIWLHACWSAANG